MAFPEAAFNSKFHTLVVSAVEKSGYSKVQPDIAEVPRAKLTLEIPFTSNECADCVIRNKNADASKNTFLKDFLEKFIDNSPIV